MKKIRKILIVLVTIFSMSTTCIINNNVVNATNAETKLDNTREILPSKLNPKDPNSPILTNPLDPLSAVKKGDIRYDALKNQMSPKYSVQQIKDKITDLDNQIANTNDVAIKQKL